MNAITPLYGESVHLSSVEAEQQVLGLCLSDQRLVQRVSQAGGITLFHDPVHAALFERMEAKDRAAELVTPITMKEAMGDRLDGLGGPAYMVRLMGASLSSATLKGYLSSLAEMAHKRCIAAAITEAHSGLLTGDPASQVASSLETRLLGMDNATQTLRPVSMMAAVVESVEATRRAYLGETDNVVKSGLPALDAIIPGFYPGELTLIGGRPSMGKSAVALGIALNAAREGHTVAIASLEMTPEAMAARAISEATSYAGNAVPYTSMRKGDLTESQMKSVVEEAPYVGKLPIYFLPRGYADMGSLLSGVRQVARGVEGGLRLLVIDYAQLLRADGRTRYDQITAVSIALKALAVQMNIPVIALSQLSRQIETRDDKRPVMSDLRESGQLEQDADNVIFCYRPSYYLERDRPKDEATSDQHDAWQKTMDAKKFALELIVAKQRMGRIGTAHMNFAPAMNKLWEA